MIYQRKELLAALKMSASVCGTGKTMPILSSVVLRGKTISATDLVVSLTSTVSAQGNEVTPVALNASDICGLVANAQGDSLDISCGDNYQVTIKGGKAKYRCPGLSDKDFPSVPTYTGTWGTVESEMLVELIDRTIYAVCDDDTRFNMCGILFSGSNNRITALSTDGHRVARLSRLAPGINIAPNGVIVPERGSAALRALAMLGPMTRIATDDKYLYAQQGDTSLSIKLIGATFPVVEQIYSHPRANMLEIDRMDFIGSLKRSSQIVTEDIPAVLRVGVDSISVTTTNPDRGDVVEDIDGSYTGSSMKIGFNPRYVTDAISVMTSDRITITIGGELDPILISSVGPDDYKCIVMPMRVL